MSITSLLPDPIALRVKSIAQASDSVTIIVSSRKAFASCPICSHPSNKIHSRYTRTLADLPWQGIPVRLLLHVRRFFCRRSSCPQRIFCERLPRLTARYARGTLRLNDALCQLGHTTSGQAGARLSVSLGMRASRDTLLRRVRQTQLAEVTTPRVLGIDDFAFRKGRRYGTILVDLEQRRPIDLLPDRSTEAVVHWLKGRDGVEYVSRDRSNSYADALRQGVPKAVQIADRWHLLRNLGDALIQMLRRKHRLVKQAGSADSPAETTVSTNNVEHLLSTSSLPRNNLRQRQSAAGRERKYDLYRRAKELFNQGATINIVARALGVHWLTARKYVESEEFPERAKRRAGSSPIDRYIPYLRERWEQGCRCVRQLHEEISVQGYRAKRSPIRRVLAGWRAAAHPKLQRLTIPRYARATTPTIGPRRAAWLIQQRVEELEADERAYVERLCVSSPEIERVQSLAHGFILMVRERQAEKLNEWLESAMRSGVAEMQSLARGLKMDYEAVAAGLTYEWSNGQTEGHVNRLKVIKREMYGRAKLDLLRVKVLHAR